MARSTDPDVVLFQALADPTRLAIVRQLSADGAVCACDFTACCDVAQPTISHHLGVLRNAGLVIGERRGTWIVYRLAPDAVARLKAVVGDIRPGAEPGPPLARGANRPGLPVIQPSA